MKEEENRINYGYCRCSTNESKQDVEYQVNSLLEKGVKKENIYFEYESGGKENRPVFKSVLDKMKRGDSLFVTEISRLSRSSKQACSVIDYINNNKMRLVIGSLDVDCREDNIEPMVEGMIKMMGVFAELDRKMKIYQINLGLKNARKEGRIGGRPKLKKEDIPDSFYKFLDAYKKGIINKSEMARVLGWSRPKLDRIMKLNSMNE